MVYDLASDLRAFSLGNSASRRTKLIVGIDYGTTYTGVAFVHENEVDPKQIKVFTNWPSGLGENNQQNEKTPSIIAYADENPVQKGQDAWGYGVDAGTKSYSWTKLLLDAGSQTAKYDDPNLRTTMLQGMLQLPPGKNAVQVVGDYLRRVHDHVFESFAENSGGEDILAITPIEYWLTVPAIWSDEAKAATRKAAVLAGFGSRLIDEINLVPEPEAAAILALKTSASESDSLVEVNTGILVCDCGGGTVDITSYTIAHTSPRLVLNESCGGAGAKCGSTYIDRNLHALMVKRFGHAFTSLPPDRTGPGSRFMASFESRKRQFSEENARDTYTIPLIMPILDKKHGNVTGYDKNYKEVILSDRDLKECFEPVVQAIINLVSDQIDNVKKRNEPAVKTIVLVGGLGSSQHVRDRLKSWCRGKEIRMITPWAGAWSAVARGAALHGLGAVKIQKRIARRHYGQEISRPHQRGVWVPAAQWSTKWTNLFTGDLMIRGQMQWILAKDTVFEGSTEVEAAWNRHYKEGGVKIASNKLYSYSLDAAPNRINDPGLVTVGSLIVDFENVNLDQFESRLDKSGCRVWMLPVRVLIKLGARQGTFTFRTYIGGKECGVAHMDFSGH